jgi:hypothetical protein
MLGVATITASLKCVFAFDFDVGHDHSQHLFMNVDSRYPVRHNAQSQSQNRSGEIEVSVEKLRLSMCLIRSVRGCANNWALSLPSCGSGDRL